MLPRPIQLAFAVVMFSLGMALAQAAESDAKTRVSGGGQSKIECTPHVLRLQIDLLAKGNDLQNALSAIEKRRAAAKAKLVELGADEKSLKIDRPKVTSAKTDQQRQMEMMVRQRMQSRGKKPPAPKAEPVIVSVTLKAEWPLKSDDFEKLLIDSHAIQEKVKAADVAGEKEMEEKKTEEEEEAESGEESSMWPSAQNEIKPGTPVFLFVSRISDEQRKKAMANAFSVAKASATRLAEACGMKLGPLMDVAGSTESGMNQSEFNEYGYAYRSILQSYAVDFAGSGFGGRQQQTDEAVGMDPGKLTYQVSLQASFALER